MDSESPQAQTAPTPMWMVVIGWILSVLVGLAFAASGIVKLMQYKPPGSYDLGWSDSAMFGLGIIELSSAILYLFPRTATLGAILLTGYIGGAIATHLRMGDSFVVQVAIGTVIWFGLVLRDYRLRAILPWRRPAQTPPAGGFLAGTAKVFLTLFAVVFLIGSLVLAQRSDIKVARSVTINAAPAKVFPYVNDLKKFNEWSPFVKLDKNATYTFEGPKEGIGQVLKWNGKESGEGIMTIVDSKPNERVKIKLEFIKPFEATRDAEFLLTGNEALTKVTWTFEGNSDLLMKGVSSVMSMEQSLGGMFDSGLKDLKTLVESKK